MEDNSRRAPSCSWCFYKDVSMELDPCRTCLAIARTPGSVGAYYSLWVDGTGMNSTPSPPHEQGITIS